MYKKRKSNAFYIERIATSSLLYALSQIGRDQPDQAWKIAISPWKSKSESVVKNISWADFHLPSAYSAKMPPSV